MSRVIEDIDGNVMVVPSALKPEHEVDLTLTLAPPPQAASYVTEPMMNVRHLGCDSAAGAHSLLDFLTP